MDWHTVIRFHKLDCPNIIKFRPHPKACAESGEGANAPEGKWLINTVVYLCIGCCWAAPCHIFVSLRSSFLWLYNFAQNCFRMTPIKRTLNLKFRIGMLLYALSGSDSINLNITFILCIPFSGKPIDIAMEPGKLDQSWDTWFNTFFCEPNYENCCLWIDVFRKSLQQRYALPKDIDGIASISFIQSRSIVDTILSRQAREFCMSDWLQS